MTDPFLTAIASGIRPSLALALVQAQRSGIAHDEIMQVVRFLRRAWRAER